MVSAADEPNRLKSIATGIKNRPILGAKCRSRVSCRLARPKSGLIERQLLGDFGVAAGGQACDGLVVFLGFGDRHIEIVPASPRTNFNVLVLHGLQV